MNPAVTAIRKKIKRELHNSLDGDGARVNVSVFRSGEDRGDELSHISKSAKGFKRKCGTGSSPESAALKSGKGKGGKVANLEEWYSDIPTNEHPNPNEDGNVDWDRLVECCRPKMHFEALGKDDNRKKPSTKSSVPAPTRVTSNSQVQPCDTSQRTKESSAGIISRKKSSKPKLATLVPHPVPSGDIPAIGYLDFSLVSPRDANQESKDLVGHTYDSICNTQGLNPTPVTIHFEKRGRQIRTFPMKLMQILDDKEISPEIVSWSPHGRSFSVHKPGVFEKIVLPKFIKKIQYTSFTRQLQLWGFRRINAPRTDDGAYFHPVGTMLYTYMFEDRSSMLFYMCFILFLRKFLDFQVSMHSISILSHIDFNFCSFFFAASPIS